MIPTMRELIIIRVCMAMVWSSGVEIVRGINKVTDDFPESSVYKTIWRMEEAGLLELEAGGRYLRVTDKGKAALRKAKEILS